MRVAREIYVWCARACVSIPVGCSSGALCSTYSKLTVEEEAGTCERNIRLQRVCAVGGHEDISSGRIAEGR